MEELNEQQKYAVTYNGKHLLVLAGAGTGKTRTIIERAKFLINNGVPSKRILILSFTRKSAREIVERIKMQSDSSITDGLIGQTFHSWCMGIIKNNPKIFKQCEYTILDEDDRESCFKLLCGKNFKDKNGKAISSKSILNVYSYAMNAKCSMSDSIRKKIFDNAPQDDEAANLYIKTNRFIYEDIIKKYIAYKESRKYFDYDDILNVVSKSLKKNKEICDYISSMYDHILVDEMQDTNPLQYELLSSFYDRCKLFCVGDDAQSIYGFRGSDFNSIHQFTEIVPNSEKCKLTINYRSTQEILDLSNWLLSKSTLNYDKELIANRGFGVKPRVIHWRDEWEEANNITDKIQKSVTKYNYRYSDNMVLGRTLFGLRKVEAACIKKGISYKIYGGTGLMQSAHIRDVVAPMRIVSNYQDEIAWMRYLKLWKGIGEITASKIIGDLICEDSLDECLFRLMSMNLQEEISSTLVAISDLQYNPSESISKALSYMSNRLQEIYKEEWTSWRKDDFPTLMNVAMSSSSVNEFIAEYVLDPKLEDATKIPGKKDDECVLTTIHSAKGLESALCYIVNVSTFSFPTNRAILNGQDAIEEERRCLYVALTRAKDRLYIYRDISSIHVSESNEDSDKYYFLNDLPSDLIKDRHISDKRYLCDEEYKGEQVEIENDFNFD